MGCGASAQPAAPAAKVPVQPASHQPQPRPEPAPAPPPSGYEEKWSQLCDPDQEFNLLDYVFCLPDGASSEAVMLMEEDPTIPFGRDEEARTWKFTVKEDRTIKVVANKHGSLERRCTFEQVDLSGQPAFTSKRFWSDFKITKTGMEFRSKKEPERAFLVHRTLDMQGNVYWESDGSLVDDLHSSIFTLAQWRAEDEVLEIDGREVAQITKLTNYVCPDFFLSCFISARKEPLMCDTVLMSAKAQKARDELNKRALEASKANGGRDPLKELAESRKREMERVEQEEREMAALRKAPAGVAPSSAPSSAPRPAQWWVCQCREALPGQVHREPWYDMWWHCGAEITGQSSQSSRPPQHVTGHPETQGEADCKLFLLRDAGRDAGRKWKLVSARTVAAIAAVP